MISYGATGSTLGMGRTDAGPEVAAWRAFLGTQGFDVSSPTPAEWDFTLDSATRGWQAQNGLSPDGLVGPNTRAAAAAKGFDPYAVPQDNAAGDQSGVPVLDREAQTPVGKVTVGQLLAGLGILGGVGLIAVGLMGSTPPVGRSNRGPVYDEDCGCGGW